MSIKTLLSKITRTITGELNPQRFSSGSRAISIYRPLFASKEEKMSYQAQSIMAIHAIVNSNNDHRLNNQPDINLVGMLRQTLRDIEQLRSSTVIAHLATNKAERPSRYLNNQDITALCDVLATLPKQIERLDFIVDSPGGMIAFGNQIVSILRDRAQEINVLVPRRAHTTATMMALSANNIIMSDTATLSPFYPLAEAPNGDFLKIPDLIKTAKEYRRLAFSPFNKTTEEAYPGWSMIKSVEAEASIRTQAYYCCLAQEWLIRYMFGYSEVQLFESPHQSKQERADQRLSQEFDKAERITDFFMDCSLPRQEPIAYSQISDLGLHLSLADDKLGSLMHKAHQFSEALFDCANTSKIWASSGEYLYITDVTKEIHQ